MAHWENFIRTKCDGDGIIHVTIVTAAYPTAGDHWRQQLTGSNLRKWGRIFIDPDPHEAKERRSMAIGPLQGLYKGQPAANIDECPGAMFIWETDEIADPMPVDAKSNQQLGIDLYHALCREVMKQKGCKYKEVRGHLTWWEVRFAFE